MTSIYFVRHAQPDHLWEDDRTCPLTAEGAEDSKMVTEILKTCSVNRFCSSPYQRSVDTIAGSAAWYGQEVQTDERFRERRSSKGNNNFEMIRKRWKDFNFSEENGEALASVQKRNMQALFDLLKMHSGENLVIGTHGTALSTILNYYDNRFLCDDFLRIIDFMPYVIRLDFDGLELHAKEEILVVKKEYTGT